MTSMSNMSMTIADFAQLLDVYGAERTRWPVEARAAAAQLVGRDAQARRLLAEAEALDCVLERAPVPAVAVELALAERIITAAQRSPRIVKLPPGEAVAARATPAKARPAVSGPAATGRGRRRPRLFSREAAGAIGFLAASLVFGVAIGNSSLPPQLLPGLADMTDFAADDGNGLVQIALSDEVMQ